MSVLCVLYVLLLHLDVLLLMLSALPVPLYCIHALTYPAYVRGPDSRLDRDLVLQTCARVLPSLAGHNEELGGSVP